MIVVELAGELVVGRFVPNFELPEYGPWLAMMERCYDKHRERYASYGGRGIRVHKAWHQFTTFFAEMPRRPSRQHSLDRIDGDGHYEPGNVRWATSIEQNRNKKNIVHVELGGRRIPLYQFAAEHKMPRGILYARIVQHGLTPQQAVDKPYRLHRQLKVKT